MYVYVYMYIFMYVYVYIYSIYIYIYIYIYILNQFRKYHGTYLRKLGFSSATGCTYLVNTIFLPRSASTTGPSMFLTSFQVPGGVHTSSIFLTRSASTTGPSSLFTAGDGGAGNHARTNGISPCNPGSIINHFVTRSNFFEGCVGAMR
jgi:hypothetical protein